MMINEKVKDGNAQIFTYYVLEEESVNNCRHRYVGLLMYEIFGRN